ncbi:MAG: 16S rRNA (guanine(966)-N(2))-methyltransferase RsmD [Desulfotalea sp.]
MRIISGSARGRKIQSPPNNSIRPTSDRAREAIFSVISENIKDSCIIDFYSGTGALGIEALSRGARQVVFVDNAIDALATIATNLQNINSSFPEDIDAKIIQHNLQNSLPVADLEKVGACKADIVFADPPYSKGLGNIFLEMLSKESIVKSQGIVIVEERFTEKLAETYHNLQLTDKRVYGQAAFWIYHNK